MKPFVIVVMVAAAACPAAPAPPSAPIVIDYPAEGSIFPPEITAPTFLWRDAAAGARVWTIKVAFADGSPAIRAKSPGERLHIGEIDPRAVGPTNELPRLTPQQAAAWVWVPDAPTWEAIKRHSVEHAAEVTITGYRDKSYRRAVSRGRTTMQTSKDPVGAPIFYRDVPLMPSELQKGVIKPLAASAVPLIAWRLRNVGDAQSRVVLTGMHTCANCHSFSRDGKTLGMDLDGPQNDKGLYAIAPVAPQMSIRNENVVSWLSFAEQPAGQMRVGFMSQISPDGRYVLTTVGVDQDLSRNYYVANFKDYRFLQVFYATRGILVVYDRETDRRLPLPGADDPRYVQTNGVWSPDGRYIVFARADAKDAYPEGGKLAESANDPNETQVRYDLYRIPFNGGKGGRAEPIAGASGNGMSNSFARVSPDGRWIVFVQARNGLLMRPDSQLYIVPAAGGEARRMRCNTPLMNSWHSFSPDGRWLVFASKGGSPYTRMYLTHLDEEGNDSPPIPIDNATAANRAVNLPEFVNIPPDGLLKIDVPAAEFYTRFDRAFELAENGRFKDAIEEWNAALELNPDDARAHNNLAFALAKVGRMDEAIVHWQKALDENREYAEVRKNLGGAHDSVGVDLLRQGRIDEALPHFRKALELDPADPTADYNLGVALLRKAQPGEAIAHLERAVAFDPQDAQAHSDLGVALVQTGRIGEAVAHFEKAIGIDARFAQAYFNLGNTYYLQRRAADAVVEWRQGLRIEPDNLSALRQAAWVLATSPDAPVRNGAEAVQFAERAARLSGGNDPAVLDVLAAAYAEARRFPEAAETARRALALATRQNNRALEAALMTRIGLYDTSAPFREAR